MGGLRPGGSEKTEIARETSLNGEDFRGFRVFTLRDANQQQSVFFRISEK